MAHWRADRNLLLDAWLTGTRVLNKCSRPLGRNAHRQRVQTMCCVVPRRRAGPAGVRGALYATEGLIGAGARSEQVLWPAGPRGQSTSKVLVGAGTRAENVVVTAGVRGSIYFLGLGRRGHAFRVALWPEWLGAQSTCKCGYLQHTIYLIFL